MKIEGTKKADNLYGDAEADLIKGRQGSDSLYGGDGSDVLKGGRGDDKLFGGAGDDVLIGGKGHDLFHLNNIGDFDVIADFTPGKDKVVFNNMDNVIEPPGTPSDPYPFLDDFSYTGTVLSYQGNPVADVAGFSLSGDNLFFV